MIENPIFIVGTERSGSNLLRLILNEHEAIAIPHPPHLMRDLHPHLARYGDLSQDKSFRRLIDHAVKLVELHFMPWPREVNIDREALFSAAHERSLYAVYAQIYEQYLKATGKRRWGCKSTFMIHHARDICRSHREPRLIHLVRDGRDVAVSARDSVFSRFHPHYVAELWSEEQRVAISLQMALPPRVFRTFRYEDLISEPEKTVREVCGFLGEEFSPRMLQYFKSSSAGKLAAMSESWKNCGKPVQQANFGKFRAHLSSAEILEFERISNRELTHFGYELLNAREAIASANPSPGRLLQYWISENARAGAVELKSFLTDRNAFLRLRKRLFLRAYIRGFIGSRPLG